MLNPRKKTIKKNEHIKLRNMREGQEECCSKSAVTKWQLEKESGLSKKYLEVKKSVSFVVY